jgi:hypothetical protein
MNRWERFLLYFSSTVSLLVPLGVAVWLLVSSYHRSESESTELRLAPRLEERQYLHASPEASAPIDAPINASAGSNGSSGSLPGVSLSPGAEHSGSAVAVPSNPGPAAGTPGSLPKSEAPPK